MTNLTYEARVWADQRQKLEGIGKDLADAASEGLNVLVLAHFEDTLHTLGSHFRSRSVPYLSNFAGGPEALCSRSPGGEPPKVWVAPAVHLRAWDSAFAGHGREPAACILVAEHHPLAAKDEAILEAAGRLPCLSRIVFHASLDDALLAQFGGDRIASIIKMLGLEDGEYISHPLVSSAVRKAQEKIGKKVVSELPTRSAGDWFKFNLPDAK